MGAELGLGPNSWPAEAQAAAVHRVQSGETLGGIARRAGVSLDQLKQANHLRSQHIRAGQLLRLPPRYRHASAYHVQRGDSLSQIAARYQLSLRALVQANAGLQASATLREGQALYIPARRVQQGPDLVHASANVNVTARTLAPPTPQSKGHSVHWRWPVRGWISSGYGERTLENHGAMHYGIDIVVPIGTPVHATRSGQVLESRADFARGWGWTIILDHGDGWLTRYAHLSKNLVRVGDTVVRGQIIARSGNTGRSTGPHLHFGTYLHWVPHDPLTLLP